MKYVKIGITMMLFYLIAFLVVTIPAAASEINEEELILNISNKEILLYEDVSVSKNPIAFLPINAAGYIIEDMGNGVLYITSGNLKGYIKNLGILRGKDAWKTANESLDKTILIESDTVFVYEDEELKGRVIDLLSMGDEVSVLSVKNKNVIEIDLLNNNQGFISSLFTEVSPDFTYAKDVKFKNYENYTNNYLETFSDDEDYNISQMKESVTIGGEEEISGEDIVSYALQFVGNPYVWGGESLLNGTDCSGFVKGVYNKFDITLPRTSEEQRTSGYQVCEGWNEDLAQKGDLICYDGHIAIYIGNGKIVHAANSREGIIVSNADYRKVLCIRRVLGSQQVLSISEKEKNILYRIVEAEAGGENFRGKLLVANVILNRVASTQFPNDIKSVVFQSSGGKYQFSPIKDGRYFSVTISEETKQAVNKALGGTDLAQGALYFMNPQQADISNVRWFETDLCFLFKYGTHSFYK